MTQLDPVSMLITGPADGSTLATVKIHIFRAKEKLRKILTPYLEEV